LTLQSPVFTKVHFHVWIISMCVCVCVCVFS
jgi:hypothetical protein